MIVDHISNIADYATLGPNFATAVRFVNSVDLETLKPGHYEVDEQRVFANVVDRELNDENTVWELHEKYADIHLILSGSEVIGYYPISRLPELPAFDSSSDSAVL